MNKELTPLEALESIRSTWNCYNPNSSEAKDKHFDIVETALKDYEVYEEILKDYGFNLSNFREACFTLAQFRGNGFVGIEKKLKALEIIKKYPFIVHHILKGTTYYDLQHEMPYTELPVEEEYDLLKEILE